MLAGWRQMPARGRISLRGLARQLGTSHQLLKYYLDGLEKWEYMERSRRAQQESDQIIARAILEDRPLTQFEEDRRFACTIASFKAKAYCVLLDDMKKLKREARRGPLHPDQFKMLKFLAQRGLPGAQELVERCLRVGLKQKKAFREIVTETPRQEGETSVAWVRRIWDECRKYVTNCPRMITDELLEKYSRRSSAKSPNNLPPVPVDNAKSFRNAEDKSMEGRQLR